MKPLRIAPQQRLSLQYKIFMTVSIIMNIFTVVAILIAITIIIEDIILSLLLLPLMLSLLLLAALLLLLLQVRRWRCTATLISWCVRHVVS